MTDNGDIYKGLVLSNVFNEYGIMSYSNNDVYKGYLKNGKKHGQGTLTYSSGDVYDGSWNEDVRDGYGNYIHVTGEKLCGSWSNDKFVQGYVVVKFSSDGKQSGNYKGDWVEGKADGYGELVAENGNVYKGYWKKGEKEHGTLSCNNGDVYMGSFKNDLYHGSGEFRNSEYVFNGKWKEGCKSGLGVSDYGDYTITGTWVNGCRDGVFTFSWKNEHKNMLITYNIDTPIALIKQDNESIISGVPLDDGISGLYNATEFSISKYTVYHGDMIRVGDWEFNRHGYGVVEDDNEKTDGNWVYGQLTIGRSGCRLFLN